jgi:hypothetical protein
MPDYLLTPGFQGILDADAKEGAGGAVGLGSPEATPEGPSPDFDHTVALLPASQLARGGYTPDATVALFPTADAGAYGSYGGTPGIVAAEVAGAETKQQEQLRQCKAFAAKEAQTPGLGGAAPLPQYAASGAAAPPAVDPGDVELLQSESAPLAVQPGCPWHAEPAEMSEEPGGAAAHATHAAAAASEEPPSRLLPASPLLTLPPSLAHQVQPQQHGVSDSDAVSAAPSCSVATEASAQSGNAAAAAASDDADCQTAATVEQGTAQPATERGPPAPQQSQAQVLAAAGGAAASPGAPGASPTGAAPTDGAVSDSAGQDAASPAAPEALPAGPEACWGESPPGSPYLSDACSPCLSDACSPLPPLRMSQSPDNPRTRSGRGSPSESGSCSGGGSEDSGGGGSGAGARLRPKAPPAYRLWRFEGVVSPPASNGGSPERDLEICNSGEVPDAVAATAAAAAAGGGAAAPGGAAELLEPPVATAAPPPAPRIDALPCSGPAPWLLLPLLQPSRQPRGSSALAALPAQEAGLPGGGGASAHHCATQPRRSGVGGARRAPRVAAAPGVRDSIPLFVLNPGVLGGAVATVSGSEDLLPGGKGSVEDDAFLDAGQGPAGQVMAGGALRRLETVAELASESPTSSGGCAAVAVHGRGCLAAEHAWGVHRPQAYRPAASFSPAFP